MSLDVWFREDVRRVLQAARLSGWQAQVGPVEMEQGVAPTGSVGVVVSREMAAYWRGYEAALATIGVAFGLVEGVEMRGEGG